MILPELMILIRKYVIDKYAFNQALGLQPDKLKFNLNLTLLKPFEEKYYATLTIQTDIARYSISYKLKSGHFCTLWNRNHDGSSGYRLKAQFWLNDQNEYIKIF